MMRGAEGSDDFAAQAALIRDAYSSRDVTAFPRRWPHRFGETITSTKINKMDKVL